MSIALVVTRGFGNGTLSGTIKDAVTSGYSIGEEASVWTKQIDSVTSWSSQTDATNTWSSQADTTTTWTKQ